MIKRVFVDTDIILDVALARKPFLEASHLVLSLLENNIALGYVSSNCITNLYYVFRKVGGDVNAREFITRLLQYLTVISIEHSDVVNGLKSNIRDLEDALQHYSALRNQCDCIITRNLEDYKNSLINVYSPIEFLNLYKEKL